MFLEGLCIGRNIADTKEQFNSRKTVTTNNTKIISAVEYQYGIVKGNIAIFQCIDLFFSTPCFYMNHLKASTSDCLFSPLQITGVCSNYIYRQ